MNPTIRDIPTFTRSASFEPSTVDAAKRTVDMVWTTGARVLRSNYYDGPFFEELSLDPKHVRMGRLSSGAAPFLKNHNRYDIGSTLGVIESARLERGRGVATVRFPKEGIDPEADKVFQKIADGILRNVSVGYANYKFEKVEGGADKTPVFRAVDWEPQEVSLVTIGADAEAGFRSADVPTNPCEFVTTRGAPPHEGAVMDADQVKKDAELKAAEEKRAAEAQAVREKEIQERATATERERVSGIQRAVRAAKLGDEMESKLIADATPLEQARALILDKLATESDKNTERRSSVDYEETESASQKFIRGAGAWLVEKSGKRRVIEAAIEAKARGFEKVELDPGEFRGMSLVRLAEESLVRRGVNVRGLDRNKLVGMALTHRSGGMNTTSDFAVLLESAIGKVLLGAYATTPDTWSRFCKVDTVQDFRDSNRYRSGSFGALDALNESGEFKNKSIPDGEKASISVGTKGNIIALSRQAIINDDMGAIADTANKLGRAARMSIEIDVYALLAQNSGLGPTMADGKTFFHADHGNLNATGSALSTDGLDADRVVMASQTDPSGNEILDIRPSRLVVPIGLGAKARVINTSIYDPDATNKLQKPNPVLGLFSDVVDTARLAGTRRYLFADPAVAAAMVVAFLEGQGEAPYLEQEMGWRVDGTEWKVRLDYKAQAFDTRGAVTNSGAA